MQIFRSLAGYSLGRADIVRRAMSKKKHGCNGAGEGRSLPAWAAQRRWVRGGGRAVRKHGVACKRWPRISLMKWRALRRMPLISRMRLLMQLISYRTAWLKCYYPREYLAALLTSVLDNEQQALLLYCSNVSRLSIHVLAAGRQYRVSWALTSTGRISALACWLFATWGAASLRRFLRSAIKAGKFNYVL